MTRATITKHNNRPSHAVNLGVFILSDHRRKELTAFFVRPEAWNLVGDLKLQVAVRSELGFDSSLRSLQFSKSITRDC